MCLKEVFQGSTKRQNISSTEAESDLSTNISNIKGSLADNKITQVNFGYNFRNLTVHTLSVHTHSRV